MVLLETLALLLRRALSSENAVAHIPDANTRILINFTIVSKYVYYTAITSLILELNKIYFGMIICVKSIVVVNTYF